MPNGITVGVLFEAPLALPRVLGVLPIALASAHLGHSVVELPWQLDRIVTGMG